MNKEELIEKYANKCNEAKAKHAEARRNKHNNKHSNPEEAKWDELDQEGYSREFRLAEEILKDLKNSKES